MALTNVNSILMIGMAGGLAKITAGLLLKTYPEATIVGVDSRESDQFLKDGRLKYQRMKYTRSNFEKLFRNNKFDAVLHLGRISHTQANPRAHLAERLDLNVMGTNRILELSLHFEIKKVIILSTYHVYGAYADNPIFLKEDSILRASLNHPELRDVVEMDQLASNWMWKYQHQIETLILRPCSIIGPQIRNAMAQYLVTKYVPVPMDYNPMLQFIHEYDMANTLVHALKYIPTGIYNVATNESMSLHEIKDYMNIPYIPVPVFLLEQVAKVINQTFWSVPDYLIDYLKYPCILSNTELKKHLPPNFFKFSTREILNLIKQD
ncbi:MAG: NAD-dependent epimerase/dehydratase family protein, partial [Bdellovibrionota bacterium]